MLQYIRLTFSLFFCAAIRTKIRRAKKTMLKCKKAKVLKGHPELSKQLPHPVLSLEASDACCEEKTRSNGEFYLIMGQSRGDSKLVPTFIMPWSKNSKVRKPNFSRCQFWMDLRGMAKNNGTSFLGRRGIVHTEFVPAGQTVYQVFFIKMYLNGSEKGSFTWDQTSQTNGYSIMTMPHVTQPYLSCNFLPHKPLIHLTSAPVTFSFFLNLKISSKDVILGL